MSEKTMNEKMMSEAALVAGQYGSAEVLNARVELHRRFTVGPDLEAVVDEELWLKGNEAVLDVGTGPAGFPARLVRGGHRGRVVGMDLNAGMFPAAGVAGVELVVGDAVELPFGTAEFDVVTARHMLYHVEDVAGALSEMRRALRPGGRFLAVTNCRDSMGAFWDIVAEAAREYPALEAMQPSLRVPLFNDANGAKLVREAFGNSRERVVEARLEVTEREAVERYFLSCLPGRAIEVGRALAAFRGVMDKRWAGGWPASGMMVIEKGVVLVMAVSPHS